MNENVTFGDPLNRTEIEAALAALLIQAFAEALGSARAFA